MMSRMLGAPLGGTIVGGQPGLESAVVRPIFPGEGAGGGGILVPSRVVVALGEPGVPVVCICAPAEGAIAVTATARIAPVRIRFVDFIGVNLVCCSDVSTNLSRLLRAAYRTLGQFFTGWMLIIRDRK